MAPPADSSIPRLAAGCRWATRDGASMVLFPEGAIRLQGTGQRILELCDGRTFVDLITQLQNEFSQSPPDAIRADASRFLEQLRNKRIVDY